MGDERTTEARDALQGLSERDRAEVLGILCGSRPEAVLGAVSALQRHRAVVAQLRSERPPGEVLF